MLNRDLDEAVAWGERAVALAQALGAHEVEAAALVPLGAATMFGDFERGCAALERAIALAAPLPRGDAIVADAYVMLGSASGEIHRFEAAERWLAEGLTFARARDLDRLAGYMAGWQALCDLAQGRWDRAGERAHALMLREVAGSTNRVIALLALGRLRLRRGDPGSAAVLDEALALAARTGTLQRLAPVCAARAEAAWMAGDAAAVRAEVERVFDSAKARRHPWFAGELAYWLSRVDPAVGVPGACAGPWRLQMEGCWREAAEAWLALGCPYEAARSLADGDEAARREALTILDRLGARPLAERVRQALRAQGAVAVPRGPRAATRANAAGLTAREMQVLALLARGQRNVEIAKALSRSPRTVEHHIEAIVAKLQVADREAAVAAAQRLGLLDSER
jgi:DNA-binding CsgD family transcriptional regulator